MSISTKEKTRFNKKDEEVMKCYDETINREIKNANFKDVLKTQSGKQLEASLQKWSKTVLEHQ